MESWQDNLTSNKERLCYLYRSGKMSDVTLIVGADGETKRKFRLHKFVLSMQSNVFFTMFYGSLPENDQVEVIYIKPAIFEIVAKYFYEDRFLVRSMTEAIKTYCVAEKYNIVHLRSLCAAFITKHLSPENIPILYRMPYILETLKIKSKCDEILSEQTSAILRSDNFGKSPQYLVKHILQLNQLCIESEAQLFECVLKWAKAARNTTHQSETLRTIVHPFLPHIRFLAMNVEEFLYGPARSGILTDTEKSSILENLAEPGCRELPTWCNKNTFRIALRSFKVLPNHTCTFLDEQHLDAGGVYAIVMNVTKGTLNFRGVSFYVAPSGTGNPRALFYIREYKHHENIVASLWDAAPYQSASSYEDSTSLMRCVLSNPATIECWDGTYVISLKLQDCRFKYCSYTLGRGLTFRNQSFDVEMYFISNEPKVHLYEIIYS